MGQTFWRFHNTNKHLKHLMLSLWLPGHNCTKHIDFKIFIHLGGLIFPNFITLNIYNIFLAHKCCHSLNILSYLRSLQGEQIFWIYDITSKHGWFTMILSFWQSGHKCIEYIESKVFMHLSGSFSPNYITIIIYCSFLSHIFHSLNVCIFSNFR